MMKKVLVITYYWPPAGGPGVQRWLKFVKHLQEFDWEPVVLTVSNGIFPARDASLEAEVPPGIKVYRTKTSNPFLLYNVLRRKRSDEVPVALIHEGGKHSMFERLAVWIRSNMFIPDARRGWNRYARRAVSTIFHEHKIDVVVTTGPPHSTHLLGDQISARYRVPWLADFRDPWTTVYYNTMMPRTRITRWLDQRWENRVLHNADLVVTVTPGMKREFEDRARWIEVVTNGYDEEDMPDVKGLEIRSEKFTVTYTGNMAPSQHVPALWDALARAVHELPGLADHFRLNFVGSIDGSVLAYLNRTGLSKYLERVPYLEHREALKKMVGSSLLLLLIPQTPGNKLIMTGKIFEYLASGTPVLAVGPTDGDAAALLHEANRNPMIDFSDQPKMLAQITEIYSQWMQNDKVTKREDLGIVEKISRRNCAQILSRLLGKLME